MGFIKQGDGTILSVISPEDLDNEATKIALVKAKEEAVKIEKDTENAVKQDKKLES